MRTSLMAASLLFASTSVLAQDRNPGKQETLDDFQAEISSCVSYYKISNRCIPDNDKTKNVKEYQTKAASILTKTAADIGLAMGMTKESIQSRFDLMHVANLALLNGSCAAASSLIRRHALRCRKILEDHDRILDELLQR